MRRASLLALVPVLVALPASAAGFTFTSVDDDHIAWEDVANWSPAALPGNGDDATISAGLLRGAEIKDSRAVNSLLLDSGLNVYVGGTLVVTNGITGNAGYFINSGVVRADVLNGTYIANTGDFTGDMTNTSAGAVINDGDGTDGRIGRWTGDVTNAGFVSNSFGIWSGDVLGNTGTIVNASGAIWTGDIDNAADFESTDSVWNGNLTNSGTAILSGTFNGDIANSGTVWMGKPLVGVRRIVNTGRLGMEDGAADDTLSVRSWSGTGTLTVDFDLATGRSDKVVLSGDYSADTLIEFRIADPDAPRLLGETPVIVVGGANSGSATTSGLPDGDGAIVYALQRSGNDWVVAATPGAVVTDVAGLWTSATASLGDTTRKGLGHEGSCTPGASLRGLYGDDASGLRLDLGLACLALHDDATLGIGVTLGMANGSVSRQSAGLYAELVDGAFRAALEGQVAATQLTVADARLGPDPVQLDGLGANLSGTASYALVFGAVTFAPELGLALRSETAGSADFGNAGSIRLTSGPTASAQVGATLSAALVLDGATTLTPFATIALEGDLASSGVMFTDSAGTSVALAVPSRSPVVALALGADLVRDEGIEAGLRADVKVGQDALHTAASGNLRVPF